MTTAILSKIYPQISTCNRNTNYDNYIKITTNTDFQTKLVILVLSYDAQRFHTRKL